MSETELSLSQHEQAVKLHNRIMASAALAQQSLCDMCTSLKEMRDGKLYKELGYQNFEDYCENEVGMKRRNVYNYISIVENVENVQSIAQIGMTKLSLLATISEEQQQEISERVNLEETTVKQLKAEIDKLKSHNKDLGAAKDRAVAALTPLEEEICQLKGENSELERKSRFDDAEKRSLQARLDDTGNALRKTANEKEELKQENSELRESIKELENRPVEVAVVDNSAEYEEKLKAALEAANQENRQHEAELEAKFREENEAIRKKLEEEKQIAVSEVRSDYEKRLSESAAAAPVDEDKLKFKVYLTSAYDILGRLLGLASQHTEPIYKEKIKQLLNNVLTNMEDSQLWRN